MLSTVKHHMLRSGNEGIFSFHMTDIHTHNGEITPSKQSRMNVNAYIHACTNSLCFFVLHDLLHDSLQPRDTERDTYAIA